MIGKEKYCIVRTLLLTLMFLGCQREPENIVATVHGLPITTEEFLHHLTKSRAIYLQHRSQAARSSNGEGESHYSPHNHSYLRELKKQTLKQLVRLKVEQSLALDLGIIPTADFSQIKREWKVFNLNRSRQKADRNIIYGPVHYSFDNFVEYQTDAMVRKLKEHLHAELFKSGKDYKIFSKTHPSLFPEPKMEPAAGRKNLMISRYIDDCYRRLVQKLVEEADVQVNKKEFENIVMP